MYRELRIDFEKSGSVAPNDLRLKQISPESAHFQERTPAFPRVSQIGCPKSEALVGTKLASLADVREDILMEKSRPVRFDEKLRTEGRESRIEDEHLTRTGVLMNSTLLHRITRIKFRLQCLGDCLCLGIECESGFLTFQQN